MPLIVENRLIGLIRQVGNNQILLLVGEQADKHTMSAPYRLGDRLHPLTIEQNAITSVHYAWPPIPCFTNTIGPWVIFNSNYAIENNLAESIDLNKLAEITGMSPKYLCRIFKEYTSKTLVQYINELRIENACYEMSVNDKNISVAS